MLSELYIKNLAIIEEATIPFSDHFNVFTGETGAGKSILINGINSVLGQRITKDIVRAGCDKAVITALFTDLSDKVERPVFSAAFLANRSLSRMYTECYLKNFFKIFIKIHKNSRFSRKVAV